MRFQQIIAVVARRLNVQAVREILTVDVFARIEGLTLCMACDSSVASVDHGMYSGSHSSLMHSRLNGNPPNQPVLRGWPTTEAITATGTLKRLSQLAGLTGLASGGTGSSRQRTS